jgi:hypothetical protein
VAYLLAQNTIRAEELLPVRNGGWRPPPWTYYRGAAAVMAADLGSRPHSGLIVQLCGDAHLLNFGLWATPERNLSFDLRDFDETLPGPFEWDVARLVASIVVLARTYGVRADRAESGGCGLPARLPGADGRLHQRPLARHLVRPDRRRSVPQRLHGPGQDQCRCPHRAQSAQTNPRRRVPKFTEYRDGHLRIIEDPPIRQHRADGLAEELFAAYHDSLPDERRHLLDRFTLIDTVRQVVGVGQRRDASTPGAAGGPRPE